MSKAFVKEDQQELEVDQQTAALPSGTQHISAAGRRRLEQELDQLWRVERPRVTREVEAAAALGDRSENAEYIYGKRRLREIDRRLRFLKRKLEHLVVVDAQPPRLDRVYFWASVTVRDEQANERTYRLVGGDEIDLEKRWVSVASPMGQALLGKGVGDVVIVKRPKGDVELEIVGIRYDE
ncbi:MAG: transcription elongation factor GreB [Myxococcota bacterium]